MSINELLDEHLTRVEQVVLSRDHEAHDFDGRGRTVLTSRETWSEGGERNKNRTEMAGSVARNPRWETLLEELDHRFIDHTWSQIRRYVRQKGFKAVSEEKDGEGRVLLMGSEDGLLVGMVENKALDAQTLFVYGVQDIGEDGTAREVSPFGLSEHVFRSPSKMFFLMSHPLRMARHAAMRRRGGAWDEVMTHREKCTAMLLSMRNHQSDLSNEGLVNDRPVSPDAPEEGFVRTERLYYAWRHKEG